MASPESGAIITLGRALEPDGSLGVSNKIRLATTLELYKEKVASHLIMSGGGLLSLQKPYQTEADLMRSYLIRQGIPSPAIHVEAQSLDTIGNALYTRRLLEGRLQHLDLFNLTFVTSEWHLERATQIMHWVFDERYSLQAVAAPEKPGLRELVGETAGILTMKQILKGVRPGDVTSIEQRLLGNMPAYAAAVELPQAA